MAKLAEHVDTVVEPEEIVEAGDRIVMLGWSNGTVRASGRRFHVRAIHVWSLANGKAHRLECTSTPPAQLAALRA